MKIEHAQPEAFRKMIAGEASSQEAKAIVRHLLGGCGRCIKRSQAAQEEIKSQTWNYDQVFANLESLLDGGEIERLERAEPLEAPRRVAYAGMRH
jgi:hypothetical protein